MTEMPTEAVPSKEKLSFGDRLKGFWRRCEIYLAAAGGGFLLSFADLAANNKASMTLKVQEVLRRLFSSTDLDSGAIAAILFIIGAACFLCWLHPPNSKQAAFARGITVFAVLNAIVPFKPAPAGLDKKTPEKQVEEKTSISTRLYDALAGVAYAAENGRASALGTIELVLASTEPDSEFLVTIRNAETAKVLGQETVDTDVVVITRPSGTYTIEIEAQGYRRVRTDVEIDSRKQRRYEIEMEGSGVPLFFQRLYSPKVVSLASQAKDKPRLSKEEIREIIEEEGFGLPSREASRTFVNVFKSQTIKSADVVTDRATGLMWQKGGSAKPLSWRQAKEYVQQLNAERHGGFSDWRIPEIDELLSLFDASRGPRQFIDTDIFDRKITDCWSDDVSVETGSAWRITFVDEGGFPRLPGTPATLGSRPSEELPPTSLARVLRPEDEMPYLRARSTGTARSLASYVRAVRMTASK